MTAGAGPIASASNGFVTARAVDGDAREVTATPDGAVWKMGAVRLVK